MPDAQTLGGGSAVALDADVFEQPFNGPLVHEVVIAELAARRQGTHATKTPSMVSAPGAKPWRQKGTGRARAGTTRSPIWTGGGTVFGPSPRSYVVKVNRKARKSALRSALSVHAERATIHVVDAAAFDAPSTAKAAELIASHRGGAVLVVIADGEVATLKSFRNLSRTNVLHADDVGVADLVGAATLVVSPAALDSLTNRARNSLRGPDGPGSSQNARPDDERRTN